MMQFIHDLPELAAYIFSHCSNPVIITVIIAANLISAALYAADKHFAVNGKWRIPESTLITASFFGTVGAIAAMSIFRHKTKKQSFRIKLFFAIFLKILLIGISIFITWRFLVAV